MPMPQSEGEERVNL